MVEYAVQQLSGGNEWVVNLVTGLLSAAMPIGWYLGVRELMSCQAALVFAVLIGLLPTTLAI